MAVNASDDYGVGRSLEGFTSGQHCQYGEALAEWRSCEQVDNGTPSTSPPYWDIEDDDDFGAKPPELYGRYTWKIEKFSQTSKRELKSEVFDVGSYKWYILIYPQGCDVCNHLSLFLCVANHDKLLPGWSHFAQFTIAVVNKDPKKSKYSDTLHRFWKKEHDWGWKKFMELSKVQEGFVVADTLEIRAQVQIIREKAHRPFRCLDRQYRRELVRVYLTNVEQICRRFVEERRGKLGKLIEDRVRWLSFCAFWVGVDHKTRDRMSREKTDVILRVVVKHFFVEKEVTSTLVMDSLNSGLKALEAQSRSKKGKTNLLVNVETSAPIVRVEDDMFVLVDDVLSLLERAALEPSPPKDEKGLQNRTKDGNFGEDFNKDSIERDERRLTELGRKTVEIFVLAHIFSNKIEVAYQEAVALKRQEELIREEEAAELAEIEQKAKRRVAEKEKRSKKKLSKQKRSSRKGKDRGKDEKCDVAVQDKHQRDSPIDERIKENTSVKLAQSRPEMLNDLEVVSDVSDIEDDVGETTQLDAEDRDTGPVNWDIDTSEAHPSMEPCSRTNGLPVQNGHAEKSSSFMDDSSSDTGPVNWDIDTSEAHPSMEPCGRTNDLPVQNGHAEKSSSLMDDSSSTCSTDSVPSVAMNGPCKGNILPNYKSQKSPSRRKNQGSMETCEQISQPVENNSLLRDPVMNAGHLHNDASRSSNSTVPELKAVSSLKDRVQTLEQHLIEKEVVVLSLKKLNVKDQVDFDGPPKQTTVAEASSSPRSSTKTLQPKSVLNSNAVPVSVKDVFLTKVPQTVQPKSVLNSNAVPVSVKEVFLTKVPQSDAMVPSIMQKPQNLVMSKPDVQKTIVSKPLHRPIDILVTDQVPVRSRSSSVAVPGSRSTAPTVSMVQTASSLPWSVCAAGRLDPDPPPATDSFVPQSFRNTITAKNLATNVIDLLPPSSLADNTLLAYSQPPAFVLSPQSTMRTDQGLATSGFTFGSVTPEVLHNQPYWTDASHDNAMGTALDSSFLSGSRDLDSYGPGSWGLETDFTDEFPAGTSAPQAHRFSLDGFPHLDIINSLLDEELGNGKTTNGNAVSQSPSNGFHHPLTRQFTFPNEMSSLTESTISGGRFDQSMAYYHNDDIQPLYGSFTSHMNGLTDASLQVDFPVYGNGQIDGGIQNQWPVGFGSNLCLPSDGYPFHMPEYSNLVCGADGYTILQHSNGH